MPGTEPSFRTLAQQAEKQPPCQAHCANSGDVRGWMGVIAQHEKNGLTREQAFDDASSAIDDISGDATMAEAATTVQQAGTQYKTALDQIAAEANCSS